MARLFIGYQGDVGSNAEAAAMQLARKQGFVDMELAPLISSSAVVTALANGNIDFGVMALRNSIGGEVEETRIALEGGRLKQVGSCVREVHHCLFRLPQTAGKDISAIASHPQALKQTELNRFRLFPQLEAIEIEDTAIGARRLANGTINPTIAVLCPESAGLANGLVLMERNLEDVHPSLTEFGLFRLGKSLQTVELPEGLELIGDYAFSGCLANIELPNSLKEIGKAAFARCARLTAKIPSVRLKYLDLKSWLSEPIKTFSRSSWRLGRACMVRARSCIRRNQAQRDADQ